MTGTAILFYVDPKQRQAGLQKKPKTSIQRTENFRVIMGACQSRRGTIPADSIHVMLGVKNGEEFKRRYGQEDEYGLIETSFRPSSGQYLDTFDDKGNVKHRRTWNKRGTMETSVWSLDSEEVEEGHDDTSSISRGLVDKVNYSRSCKALVEPTLTFSQGSLAA